MPENKVEQKPKNPPAFPGDFHQEGQNGMRLRDYFAAAAMQGMIANEEWLHSIKQVADKNNEDETLVLANCAYEQADAMLRERSKP